MNYCSWPRYVSHFLAYVKIALGHTLDIPKLPQQLKVSSCSADFFLVDPIPTGKTRCFSPPSLMEAQSVHVHGKIRRISRSCFSYSVFIRWINKHSPQHTTIWKQQQYTLIANIQHTTMYNNIQQWTTIYNNLQQSTTTIYNNLQYVVNSIHTPDFFKQPRHVTTGNETLRPCPPGSGVAMHRRWPPKRASDFSPTSPCPCCAWCPMPRVCTVRFVGCVVLHT